MLLYLLVFLLGVLTGAFSHKWLAAKFKAETGKDAQGVANALTDAVAKKAG